MGPSRPPRMASLLLVVLSTACATAHADPFDEAATGPREVVLTVENQDFFDATITANWSGVRDRLGTVTGKSTETFRMRWRHELLHLEVDFLGGGGYRSDKIDVYAGDHLSFVILPRG